MVAPYPLDVPRDLVFAWSLTPAAERPEKLSSFVKHEHMMLNIVVDKDTIPDPLDLFDIADREIGVFFQPDQVIDDKEAWSL